MESSHARAQALGWTVKRSGTRFVNKALCLREDELLLTDGGEVRYAYVEKGPAVIIVPVTREGQVVMVRQFRYPVDEHCLEVPAGTARDAGARSLPEVAAKELREEIGAEYERMEEIAVFFSNSSLTDEKCHVFLARGVTLSHSPRRERTEEMEIVLAPVEEAIARARRGEMKTGPSALAVLLAEPFLSSRQGAAITTG